jgi:flagellar motor switch protein FliM
MISKTKSIKAFSPEPLDESVDGSPCLERLSRLYAEVASHWRASLGSITPKPVSIELLSVSIKSYSEYIEQASSPADIQVYEVDSLQTLCAWSLDSRLIAVIVDCMFGGSGRIVGRDPQLINSEVEKRIRSRVFNLLATAHESAWQPAFALRMAEIRQEQQFSSLRLCANRDQIMHAQFHIHVGQSAPLWADFCISMKPVDMVLTQGASEGKAEGGAIGRSPWGKDLQRRVQRTPLELAAILAEKEMTIGDFLKLSIGQVLPITIPQVITVRSDATAVFTGHYGVSNGRYAVQVEEIEMNKFSDSLSESAQIEAPDEASGATSTFEGGVLRGLDNHVGSEKTMRVPHAETD